MSAPKTNLDKQERQHRGPLAGMKGVVVFALALLVLLIGYLAWQGNEPEDASEPAEATATE